MLPQGTEKSGFPQAETPSPLASCASLAQLFDTCPPDLLFFFPFFLIYHVEGKEKSVLPFDIIAEHPTQSPQVLRKCHYLLLSPIITAPFLS